MLNYPNRRLPKTFTSFTTYQIEQTLLQLTYSITEDVSHFGTLHHLTVYCTAFIDSKKTKRSGLVPGQGGRGLI